MLGRELTDRLLFVGPASEDFGKTLAKRLGLPLLSVTVKEFSDTETRFKVEEEVHGTSILLVQSTYPPVDRNYMQLFLAAHHLSQEGAKVHAVIPYLGYARQDKQFMPGEVVSLGVISHLLRTCGVLRVTTVDIHSAVGLALFAMPTYSVSAIPILAQYIKKNMNLSSPVVISPDFGSSKRTEAFATIYGAEHLQFAKERDRVTGEVRIDAGEMNVKGRDVVIVDDMISTGATDPRRCREAQEGSGIEDSGQLRPPAPGRGRLREAHRGGCGRDNRNQHRAEQGKQS